MASRKQRSKRDQGQPRDPVNQPSEFDDPQMMAAIDLIGRTGASNFQIRYSDDEMPVVWIAVAEFKSKEGSGYQVASAFAADAAIYALCDQLLDGGRCTHCHKVTGFTTDFDEQIQEVILRDEAGEEETLAVCWYQYDPELKVYRRGCE